MTPPAFTVIMPCRIVVRTIGGMLDGLANPWPVEARLAVLSRAKHLAAPLLRRCRWAYRAKEALGW